MIVNSSMYPVTRSFTTLSDMKAEFDRLQTQLATGDKATDLAAMGSSRLISLSLRSRISSIEGYQGVMDTLNLRISVMSQALSQMAGIQADARSATTVGDYGTDDINFTVQPQQARSSLDMVLTLLNSEENGRYLFAGNATDTAPVAPTDAVLDGEAPGKAGFVQIAAERLAADQGTGFNGRLTSLATPVAGSTATPPVASVTLSEDGDHPFGLKLGTLTASGTALALAAPGPSDPQPRSETISFNTQPAEGDTVTLGFALPDGTSTNITLEAVTGTPGAGQYQIGADTDATATNFQAALTAAIQVKAKTGLVAASHYAAADGYFNGQGATAMRVDLASGGGSAATATALRQATATDTVLWYGGQNSANSGESRGSINARVGDGTTVAYGAEATESGPVGLVRALAVMAISGFSGDTGEAIYDATVSRGLDRLSSSHDIEPGSIKNISVALGLAQTTAKTESDRHTAYKGQLEDILGGVEGISNEEVTMRILSLQTRLQASYQTTAMLSRLSLVNYLP